MRRVYLSGRPLHEVPFTATLDGRPVRGIVDCLVYQEARVTILEFKTGRPRPEHQAQVEIYRRAVEALVPDRTVDVVMVYAKNDGSPQGASA